VLTIFIGILVAGFVGLGVAAFYPAPKAPEFPSFKSISPTIQYGDPGYEEAIKKSDEAYAKAGEEFDKANVVYKDSLTKYNQEAAAIVIGAAVLLLVLSLTVLAGAHVIADGVLLGSLFLLVYPITLAFNTGDNKFEFIVVAIALAVTLLLTYLKFVRPAKKELAA
jgi:hypothetical protein